MSVLRPNRRHGKKSDKAFLEFIRSKPCVLAGKSCSGPVTAHHAGQRGLMQKADDRTALPLCMGHHLTRPDAVHVLGKAFYAYHGLDKAALIENFNTQYKLDELGAVFTSALAKLESETQQ